jgi:hypothetical protein
VKSDTRNYGKFHPRFAGGGLVMAHHEQSETIQNEKGEWVNVYGAKTPKAGQQLPDTPTYPDVETAVEAAKKRSEEYGKAHPEHEDE